MSVKLYDIIFIDGLHESHQVDKDIKNSLISTEDNGFVLLHDCSPPTKKHAQVPRGSQVDWMGDVYKSFLRSRLNNPQHKHFVVDTDWGVGVICKNQKDENLDKNFVKDLSLKLLEWTGERWIISFSKIKGEISIKEKEKNKIIELVDNVKNTEIYKNVLKKFPDANLINVKDEKKKDNK